MGWQKAEFAEISLGFPEQYIGGTIDKITAF